MFIYLDQQTVLSAGLTVAQLADHVAIIGHLRTRCNAGRNRHVWRHQFALCFQLPHQTADNWMSIVKIRGSRPVSEPLKAPFREELESQIQQGIIRKVPPYAVTPWIHGVVVVPKKQGGIRFFPDYRPLNKWLIGAKFDNPTPFQAVRSIPQGMRFFTVVDALKGYHQCALDEESMGLTTFATPEGLHQYI